jgi:uncharacterized protein DUF4282
VQDLLFLNSMITPKVMTFIYWLLLASCVIGGLVSMFTVNFLAGLFGMLVGVVMVRVWCELVIVLFRINEALQAIRAK